MFQVTGSDHLHPSSFHIHPLVSSFRPTPTGILNPNRPEAPPAVRRFELETQLTAIEIVGLEEEEAMSVLFRHVGVVQHPQRMFQVHSGLTEHVLHDRSECLDHLRAGQTAGRPAADQAIP